MSYSGWDLQKAIYSALTANSSLMSVVTGIFDHVNQNTNFPYVQIGESNSEAWDTQDVYGTQHDLMIHVWSRTKGRKQTKEICKLIYDTLHDKQITIENNHLVILLNTLVDDDIDPDGLTYHGVMRFRALTQSN